MIEISQKSEFKTLDYKVDLCVIGGGLAGMCAAISAARRGCKVVLMHDRPVLGGNASSEIRMWIRGANGEDMRETGIVEEIALENSYRNPNMNFSIWDSILYEKVMLEKNIKLLLNCTCIDAKVDNNKIKTVTGWQLTTQKYHRVSASIFADCSGDSILAPLTGAKHRIGREGRVEFNEDIAPDVGDKCTMGLSCLMQARQTSSAVKFIAPKWAYSYTKEDFPDRINFSSPEKWADDNFWWVEIGGLQDSIHDTEALRDELLKIAYGVWDFIKNSGEVESTNWDLEWMGFLPGKRESRRYIGDYIMNQNDVRSSGKFGDIIAYGGWSMDDHDPRGFLTNEKPTQWHPAPSPYGIPYRCIYSCNIDNLMFAGRNISATHSANSSTRVMATCGVLGQALGNAVAIAISENLLPREIYPTYINKLQQNLMEDGCYIPWHKKELDTVMSGAKITVGDVSADILLDGLERRIDGIDHAWEGNLLDEIILTLPDKRKIDNLRLVFDCDLNRVTWDNQKSFVRRYPMKCNTFLDDQPVVVPKTIVKKFDIYIDKGDGKWKKCFTEENNYQHIYMKKLSCSGKRVKLVPLETWGVEKIRLYCFELTLNE